MALDVYGISLLSAVLWSLSMVLAKRGLADGGSTLQVALVIACVDAAVYWGLLLLRGEVAAFAAIPPFAIGLFVFAGVVATGIGRLISFTGIATVGASVNSAAISTRPLFAALLAFVLIGETVTPQVVLGILVLVGGLVLLSLSRGGDVRGWRPRDLLLPVGAAVLFASADVVRRFGFTATDATALHGVTLNETAGVAVLGAYVLANRRDAVRAVPRRTYGILVVSGVLNALSLLLFFEALDIGPVAVVSSLIGTTPLFTPLFALLLLGDVERVTRGVVVGASLVVAGATLITLA